MPTFTDKIKDRAVRLGMKEVERRNLNISLRAAEDALHWGRISQDDFDLLSDVWHATTPVFSYLSEYKEQARDALVERYATQLYVKQYLANDGACCPACDSLDIEGGSTEWDSGWVALRVACKNCGSTWEDVYTLSGIDNLVIGHED